LEDALRVSAPSVNSRGEGLKRIFSSSSIWIERDMRWESYTTLGAKSDKTGALVDLTQRDYRRLLMQNLSLQ
jgi:hypothetical protein